MWRHNASRPPIFRVDPFGGPRAVYAQEERRETTALKRSRINGEKAQMAVPLGVRLCRFCCTLISSMLHHEEKTAWGSAPGFRPAGLFSPPGGESSLRLPTSTERRWPGRQGPLVVGRTQCEYSTPPCRQDSCSRRFAYRRCGLRSIPLPSPARRSNPSMPI
jgi:hypothetical protein